MTTATAASTEGSTHQHHQQGFAIPTLTMPHSIESERVVCAAILRPQDQKGGRATHANLIKLLAPTDFFAEHHVNFWAVASATEAAGRACDPAGITDSARRQDLNIGGPTYIVDLLQEPMLRSATDEAIIEAAKRVKEDSLLRKAMRSMLRALEMAASAERADQVLSYLGDEVANLRSSQGTSHTGPRHISEYAGIVIDQFQAKQDGEQVDDGAPVGSRDVEKLIGKLRPEYLYVIAGRPGMGKTAAVMDVEKACAEVGRPTLLFSLEMSGISLATRHLANRSRLSVRQIQDAQLTDDQTSAFAEAAEALMGTQTYFDDSPGLGVAEIRARARAWVKDHPNGVIMVDYLQRVAAPPHLKDKGGEGQAHVAGVSAALKDMARELKVPVIALAQLNRGVEQRTNKRPMMSDLRESGQIEQDAEVIILLYRDEYYNPDSPKRGVIEYIVGKQRDGATGTVERGFDGQHMQMSDLSVADYA